MSWRLGERGGRFRGNSRRFPAIYGLDDLPASTRSSERKPFFTARVCRSWRAKGAVSITFAEATQRLIRTPEPSALKLMKSSYTGADMSNVQPAFSSKPSVQRPCSSQPNCSLRTGEDRLKYRGHEKMSFTSQSLFSLVFNLPMGTKGFGGFAGPRYCLVHLRCFWSAVSGRR